MIPHPPRKRARRRHESGQVVMWTVFLLPILLIAAGLTFDVGNMINIRDELSSAVDAAALAGAQALHDPKTSESFVRNSVKTVASANQVPSLSKHDKSSSPVVLDLNTTNAAGGDIVLGRYDFTAKTFTPLPTPVDMSRANAVRVTARLGRAAGLLPLSFGGLVGIPSYDVTRTATAALGAPTSGKPNVPMAIDMHVFDGKTKGFAAPDVINVTTRGNMEWTGFFDGTSGSTLKSLVEDPTQIPKIKKTDNVSQANGTVNSVCLAMDAKYKAGDVVIGIVTDFSTHDVVGLCSIQITDINCSGSTKYVDGNIVSYKANLDTSTYGECFGVDCRTFLVS